MFKIEPCGFVVKTEVIEISDLKIFAQKCYLTKGIDVP